MAATGEQAFRRWLINRIKETRFSLLRAADAEQLALGMGVQAEVLREAQDEKAAELAQHGRHFAHTEKKKQWSTKRSHRQLSLWCPRHIRQDIEERAQRMEGTPSELVRSIVQTLLSGPDNPVFVLPHWLYRGQISQWDRRERHDVRVLLSNGAYAALRQRAQRLNVSPLALVRASVVDYLEGRMSAAYFVSSGEMWEDPSRYWTGELTRKGEYRGHAGTIET